MSKTIEARIPRVSKDIAQAGIAAVFNPDTSDDFLRLVAQEMDVRNPKFLEESLRGSLRMMGEFGIERGVMLSAFHFRGTAFIAYCIDSELKRKQGIGVSLPEEGVSTDAEDDRVLTRVMRDQREVGNRKLAKALERDNPNINIQLGKIAYAAVTRESDDHPGWVINPFLVGAMSAYQNYYPYRKTIEPWDVRLHGVPLVSPSVVRRGYLERVLDGGSFTDLTFVRLAQENPQMRSVLKDVAENSPDERSSEDYRVISAFVAFCILEQCRRDKRVIPRVSTNSAISSYLEMTQRPTRSTNILRSIEDLAHDMDEENPYLSRAMIFLMQTITLNKENLTGAVMAWDAVYRGFRNQFEVDRLNQLFDKE